MVQGFSQNLNVRPQSNRINESIQAQNKEEVAEHENEVVSSIETLRAAIDDIQDEVGGRIRVRAKDSGVARADVEEHTPLQTAQVEQPEIESNSAKFQQNAQFNTHDHGQDAATTVAGQMAAILSDEELEKLKKKKSGKGVSSTLSEKLDILGKLEGDFKTFRFKDPEKQKVVDEFFENLGRIKNLKNRLTQLENIERKHESKKQPGQ